MTALVSKREKTRFGLSTGREYKSWRAMLYRCTREKDVRYHRYGGRGIKVCQGWNDFGNFLNDMGPRPEGRTLDRIDNDGNYSCGHCEECLRQGWAANCRWATAKEQNNNQLRHKKQK